MKLPRVSLSLSRFVVLGIAVCTPAAIGAATCESLELLSLPNTTITLAQSVSAGGFSIPQMTEQQSAAFKELPAFCRITATLRPTGDSDIKIEVWLPIGNWNNKFQAVGNGGFAGVITYTSGRGAIERGMAEAVKRGYATASTDTGHTGNTAAPIVGHSEKLTDYAYRSVHEMTTKAKAIIQAFYGSTPRYSYWNGCSTGGRQGLISAQRYPADFDGIIAGAPANYHTNLHTRGVALSAATLKNPESELSTEKLVLLNKAALNTCDATDGVTDGLVSTPSACSFDPATLVCRGGETANCLLSSQVESARMRYSPFKATSGELIFPGFTPGSELGWRPDGNAPGTFQIAYENTNWDIRTFDLDRDFKLAVEKTGITNAIDPDLQAFSARAGKLLLYHGWSDPAISPGNTINYYTSVHQKMGQQQDRWMRLFMAPGMNHCGGGNGPNSFDAVSALERWVEEGKAPDQIIASSSVDGKVVRTRPLCPYPQVAKYDGSGTIDDAANFVCSLP